MSLFLKMEIKKIKQYSDYWLNIYRKRGGGRKSQRTMNFRYCDYVEKEFALIDKGAVNAQFL